MIKLLKNLFIVAFLVGLVFLAANFSEPIRKQVGSLLNMGDARVMGVSTHKIDEKLHQDIDGKVDEAKKQALNLKVGDAVNLVTTLQKMSQQVTEFVNIQMQHFSNGK